MANFSSMNKILRWIFSRYVSIRKVERYGEALTYFEIRLFKVCLGRVVFDQAERTVYLERFL